MKINENYNFSYETKKEICNYYINNQEDIIYLFSAFLNNTSEIIMNDNHREFEVVTSYTDVIKLFKSFFSEEELTILISNKKTLKYNSAKYKLIVSPKNDEVIKTIAKFDYNKPMTPSQQQALISGIFLSSGSVSNPYNANYHLEFRVANIELFELLKSSLLSFEVNFSETFHHKKHIVYIKRIQDISDILKILNANNNMFLLEEFRISNDFINTCQRLNNLDVSNLSKAVQSNRELCRIITEVKKTRDYFSLSDNLKIYCDVRLNNDPSITMSQLVEVLNERLDKPVTKSWINHANIKLRSIYKKYNG